MTYAETSLNGHYVTARITSERAVFLAGPFMDRRQAERHVDTARRTVRDMTCGTRQEEDFALAGYGTARATYKPGGTRPAGHINDRLGLSIDPTTGYISPAD